MPALGLQDSHSGRNWEIPTFPTLWYSTFFFDPQTAQDNPTTESTIQEEVGFISPLAVIAACNSLLHLCTLFTVDFLLLVIHSVG
jgi:hypothetical protein